MNEANPLPPSDAPSSRHQTEADFRPPANAGSAKADQTGLELLQESSKAEELIKTALQLASGGKEQEAVTHYLIAAKFAENASEWHLAAKALHALGVYYWKDGPDRDPDRACRMYRRAIAAHEECGEFEEARELDYFVSVERLLHAGELRIPVLARIEMFLFWVTAGFGYRPMRVLASSVVMILVFGFVYWKAEGIVAPGEDEGPVPVTDFASAAYFSGSTFLTLNYGDLLPARHVRWVTVLEGLMGITMSSFFVVVLANRLRR
jgi:hypothetical protein